jgi:hypothetical protein
MKTIGIVVVADFATKAAGVLAGAANGDLTVDQFGRQGQQSIVSALRPAIFSHHVAATAKRPTCGSILWKVPEPRQI